jgi:hypothetical protein
MPALADCPPRCNCGACLHRRDLGISCPHCDAAAGTDCVGMEPIGWVHFARRAKALMLGTPS